jgi:hypothetical protein
VGTVYAARTAFLRADAFHGVHIQSQILRISGDFPHSRRKGTNDPLCVSCDGNSLRGASEEGKKAIYREVKITRESHVLRRQPPGTGFGHAITVFPLQLSSIQYIPSIRHSSQPDYWETLF